MADRLDPARWARVESLFQQALELADDERASWLARACGGDAELLREVAGLLQASDSGLSERVRALEAMADEVFGSAGPTAIGQRLGPYRLEAEIGRGGMGVVYRGVRVEGDFEQTVAVKVLAGALFSPDADARFRNERRILAGLEHPNIARLLDGGTTEQGVPYVIMEHVDGVPLDRYVRDQGLDLEARIWLFLAVCDAVQHAHASLVVHRDIKPSNILVTADGTPKLLDFGIAKLLEADEATDDGTQTRIMTPRYASPEQLFGCHVGTSTDVYSLGLVLYQLLAGTLPPHITGDAAGTPPEGAELVRAVLEGEPLPPSSVSGDKRLAGDLDTIALEALRRDVARRYESVRALADDLERYVTGQPIRARPPTFAYRAGKFVRRNKVAVGFATLLLVSLLGFGVAMATQAQRLARERDASEEARRASESASDFLVGLFQEAHPDQTQGADLSARDLLARGTVRAREELEDQPEILASVLDMIGRVYTSLAVWDTAESVLDEARTTALASLGPNDPTYLASLRDLGFLSRRRDDLHRALTYYQEALEGNRKLHGEIHETVALLLNNIGVAYTGLGEHEEARRYYRESVDVWDELDVQDTGGDVRNDLVARSNLATTYYRLGVLDSAIILGEQLLQRREAFFDGDNLDVAVSHNNLGYFLMAAGRYAEAEPHFNESLAMRTRIFGADHPNTLLAVENMGVLLEREGKYSEALEYFRRAADSGREAGQPRTQVGRLANLADALVHLERWDEADSVANASITLARETLDPDEAGFVAPLRVLGTIAAARGRQAEAVPLLQEAVRIAKLSGDAETEKGVEAALAKVTAPPALR